jgi:hypothetical protein
MDFHSCRASASAPRSSAGRNGLYRGRFALRCYGNPADWNDKPAMCMVIILAWLARLVNSCIIALQYLRTFLAFSSATLFMPPLV